MLRVATAAGPLLDGGVIASSLGEATVQRFVTLQTLAIGGAGALQLVTAGALQQTLEMFVRSGELTG